MWEGSGNPTVGRSAFDADQVGTLRRVMGEATPFMRAGKSGKFANSVSYGNLAEAGRPDLFRTAFECFARSSAHDFALSAFPGGYCFLLDHCAFRIHDPAAPESQLQMHYDANFVGNGAPVYNVWVTLDDVGDGAPGLTFVNPDLPAEGLQQAWRWMRQKADSKIGPSAPINIMFDVEKIMMLYGRPKDEVLFTPKVPAGSFLAFHQLVLHATEVVADRPKLRRSIEFRISGSDAVPDTVRARGSEVAVCRPGPNGEPVIEVVGTGGPA